jgi:hypothetical protein
MTGARRFSVSTPDWGQGHLTLDAIVAFVDDELAPGAHVRAKAHVAGCTECAAEVVAQLQARAALRAAGGPRLPPSLLSSLRSIPVDAELPPMPPGLSVTSDGQFVLLRDAPQARSGRLPPAGLPSGAPPTPRRFSRRARFGVVSGLVLGVLAVGALAAPTPTPPPERGVLGGAVLNVPVQARLTAGPTASTAPIGAASPAAASASGSASAKPSVLDASLRDDGPSGDR